MTFGNYLIGVVAVLVLGLLTDLTTVVLIACAFAALLCSIAIIVGLWSTSARSKTRRPR